MRPLCICIDARLTDGAGGVQQVVIGLAHGLSQLTDGDEEYLFLAREDEDAWLRPYLGGPCRMLYLPPRPAPRWRRLARAARTRVTSAAPVTRDLWRKCPASLFRPGAPQPSDGAIEQAGVDVMHFTSQGAFLTDVPSIYHLHDLQHLHLPQFFSPRESRDREVAYRTFCRQARLMAVASSWTKSDVVHQYGLPDEKVQVVPLAPPLAAYPIPTEGDLLSIRTKLALREAFVLYPAQTWAHKNHLGLLEALALLHARHGIDVPLVCSGVQNSFFPTIERRVHRLELRDQVRFVGFVSPVELQCLYCLCRAVVVPTKFEAASFPLWEAFLAGAPVACSNVTSLPEQAGDAALLFDPDRPEEIADAIARLWTDPALRAALAERGRERVAPFTWQRTARLFRAHYRRIAGRTLTEEDRTLLEEPPAV
jgi:glycosyltransferase involved in cell wall biosynthesis